MMREQLCTAMARRIGQTITPSMAIEMVRELFPDRFPVALCASGFSELSAPHIRMKIDAIENMMREMEPLEITTRHYFSDGLYAREITIPKGATLTGKIHKTVHLNIISKGKIAVVTEFGEQIIEAPATLISQPGTKRVGYALEETVWTTLHGTRETDLETLETLLIATGYEALQAPQSINIEGK